MRIVGLGVVFTFIDNNAHKVVGDLTRKLLFIMRTWSESLFILSYLKKAGGATILLPTAPQDMYEHWDVEINKVKFEVKGRKRINRHDEKFTDDIHVELRNVRGDAGWIQGKADKIVFEQENQFLIVTRADLYKLVTSNFTLQQKGKGFYQAHTRDGRKDIVTLVPLADVLKLEHFLIEKL